MVGKLCECSRSSEALTSFATISASVAERCDGTAALGCFGRARASTAHRSAPEFSPQQDRTRARSLDNSLRPGADPCQRKTQQATCVGGEPVLGASCIRRLGRSHSPTVIGAHGDCVASQEQRQSVCGCDGRQSECSECIFPKSHCPANRNESERIGTNRKLCVLLQLPSPDVLAQALDAAFDRH